MGSKRFGKHWKIKVTAFLLSLLPCFAFATDLNIQIKKDIAIGDHDEERFMHTVGILKAGSVISIPESYVVMDPKTKRPSLPLTLDKWQRAGHKGEGAPGKFKYNAEKSDEFFPVKIVSPAPGSKLGPGDYNYLALRSLARTSNATPVSVVKTAPTTSGKTLQAQGTCTDCSTQIPGTLAVHAAAADLIVAVQPPTTPPLTTTSRSTLRISAPTASRKKASRGTFPMAEACSNIISPQGKVGPWGKDIVDVMLLPKYQNAFLDRQSLGAFCPKYLSLSDSDKMRAWLWFWAALADAESSCRPNAYHGTHNADGSRLNPRPGHGLWAMERDANIRQSRGAACFNIQTVRGQATCTIDIMKETQLDRGFSAYYRAASYWGPVRRATTDLVPYMKRLKGCF